LSLTVSIRTFFKIKTKKKKNKEKEPKLALFRLAGWRRRLSAHFCFEVPFAALALVSSFWGHKEELIKF
jgi:hypothetical protein